MSEQRLIAPPFAEFAQGVFPFLEIHPFHRNYYRLLEAFATGRIRRLIVTMPPQHGKSLGASVLLPAYLLGLDPERKIALASYSATLASRFNRRVQRLMESAPYEHFFPETAIKKPGRQATAIRSSDLVEVIGHGGELFSVGREGSLTGNRVDTFILDDLYKDAMEANSPLIRENCWEWYTSVVRTRMHNRSQELIVFTRWHEEDLVGMIAARERIVPLSEWEQIDTAGSSDWIALNFEALKESAPSTVDPRRIGEPLWPEQHSLELLNERKRLDPIRFQCMYQGHPSTQEGLLYGDRFATYTELPKKILKRANYTDTADTGDDYLCSICYVVGDDSRIYLIDVVYSRERMEVTENLVAEMINRTETRIVKVESNNGGRGFARAVAKQTPLAKVEWFHQGANKEARILSNSATVLRQVAMPADWRIRWNDFYTHLTTYRRLFRANRWHDAPDVLTGIVEKEAAEGFCGRIHSVRFRN